MQASLSDTMSTIIVYTFFFVNIFYIAPFQYRSAATFEYSAIQEYWLIVIDHPS
jgi:hypothetical protein